MTTLLVIIVLVLVAIAIWQMTKMFELSQPANDTAGIATDEDNKLNGNPYVCFLGLYLYPYHLFFVEVGTICIVSSSL